MALLDNGAQINTITPKYVSDHLLQVGPITDLIGAKVTCVGLGNAYTRPLGYVIIQVQVDTVQGYDKDQIALVIPDFSNFAAQIPMILRTPTISRVVNVMKEVEVDALAMSWANARVAHLLSVHRMMTVEVGDGLKEEPDTDGYDQSMYTPNVETIEPFSSHIVPVKAGRAYTGGHINVMVQALQTEDGSLPQGLTVQNTYTELRQGSKNAVVVVRKQHGILTDPPEENPSGQRSRSIALPKPPEEVQLLEGADELQNSHTPRLTIRQRHGKLFNELDLSSLDSWAPKLVDAAHQLLAKYHDMFSLDPADWAVPTAQNT